MWLSWALSLVRGLLLLANAVLLSRDYRRLGDQDGIIVFLLVTLTPVRHKMSLGLQATKGPSLILGLMYQLSSICVHP